MAPVVTPCANKLPVKSNERQKNQQQLVLN